MCIRDRRRPGVRRLRLHPRLSGRAVHARRQGDADLRRHQPDPAPRDQPSPGPQLTRRRCDMTPDDRVRELLDTYAGPDACAADLLCDRHPADAVAFTFIEPDLTAHDLTYADLRERSERAARALADLGVGPGDRVATLMAKSENLVVTLMGIWRLGAAHVPLFTAFAPPAIALRLTASATKVVVVDAGQRAKLIPSADIPADVNHDHLGRAGRQPQRDRRRRKGGEQRHAVSYTHLTLPT